MKKLFLVVASAILFLAPARAGKIVTDSINSKVLGADVTYNVYLPDGFEIGDRHYPVVYLLHGLSDDYKAWKEKGNMQTVVDELISADECDKMVIVMPCAGGSDTHNVWNGYFNMPGWSYEDFFFTELIPQVEMKYRAGGSKGQRAVMGLSMGGGGSTVYCQRHPEMFSSCYALSAWLDNEKSQVNPGEKKDKLYYVTNAVHELSAVRFVEEADEATLEKMRTVRWYFDCGDDDFLLDLSVRIHQLMRDRKVKSELRVRNGVHNWEYWHTGLRTALPFLSRGFSE